MSSFEIVGTGLMTAFWLFSFFTLFSVSFYILADYAKRRKIKITKKYMEKDDER